MINQETPLRTLLDDKHQLKVLDYYGIEHQSLIAMEELSELQKAISKAARYVTLYDIHDPYLRNMAEEIADVLICIRQMELYYGLPDDLIQYFVHKKVERNRARLEEKIEEIYAECGDSGFGSTGK
ncbi:hypothetical protein [Absicoccus intestinalis]|uniref:NTP pyrophosphohydrolase MazG putative catalytic core domain-containing protein n=1 Tax=Absicoccus intestinalis TaxID=2926319 RepID=A0ABU4WPQ3_9FIRM|nr:hypothetical protein [Absicoccus sp. CLA-KB-P134]MDX8417389.1 hypothetical protein [Absicoccus sp. CLA-KB-P134]